MSENQIDQTPELAEEVILLRQEVVVLRESIDEFHDNLVHVLRIIADQHLVENSVNAQQGAVVHTNGGIEELTPPPRDTHSGATANSQSLLF